jgi:peroxidase
MLIMRSPNLVKMVGGNFVGVVLLVEIIVVMMSGCRFGANGLSMDYYFRSCPMVDPIIKVTVSRALQVDPTLAAGLVRMHFHDCFVEVLSLSLSLSLSSSSFFFLGCDENMIWL